MHESPRRPLAGIHGVYRCYGYKNNVTYLVKHVCLWLNVGKRDKQFPQRKKLDKLDVLTIFSSRQFWTETSLLTASFSLEALKLQWKYKPVSQKAHWMFVNLVLSDNKPKYSTFSGNFWAHPSCFLSFVNSFFMTHAYVWMTSLNFRYRTSLQSARY